jgi:hypothetical protein
MPQPLETLSLVLLALSLHSPLALGQQQWNTSEDLSDAFTIAAIPLARFGLPGLDFTIEEAVRSDRGRVGWLYESAIERENNGPFIPSANSSTTMDGSVPPSFLGSRASSPSDTRLENVVVSCGFCLSLVPYPHVALSPPILRM